VGEQPLGNRPGDILNPRQPKGGPDVGERKLVSSIRLLRRAYNKTAMRKTLSLPPNSCFGGEVREGTRRPKGQTNSWLS
jgi:hypothetical protein